MIKRFLILTLVFALSATIIQAQQGYDPEQAMKAMEMLMGGGNAGDGAEPAQTVHFRQLKEFVPEELGGLERTSIEAGKNSAMGMTIGYAEADFEGDGNFLSLRIQDISAMSGFMRMAQFAWASQEMERESADGFERTTRVDGFMAKEEFRYRSNSGTVELIVDDRFMVEVRGRGLDMDALRGVVKDLNLKKLAAMKPEPQE